MTCSDLLHQELLRSVRQVAPLKGKLNLRSAKMDLSVLLMLSAIKLNVNGIHDQGKWLDVWHEVPKCDLICFRKCT